MGKLKRLKIKKLIEWSKTKDAKPLIIYGAKQVGKTYLVYELFAKQYYPNNHYYIDFKKQLDLKQKLDGIKEASLIIKELESYYHQQIKENSLLIFDELQEIPTLRTSLKSFDETLKGKYKIICLCRYLHKTGGKTKEPFPVGKVSLLNLQPLNFEEYLINLNKQWMVDQLYENLKLFFKNDIKSIDNSIHNTLIANLKDYLIIGNNPLVLSNFLDNKNYQIINTIKKRMYLDNVSELINYFNEDFKEMSKSTSIYKNLIEYSKKKNKVFVLNDIKKNSRYEYYKDCFDSLLLTGLIYKLNCLYKPTTINGNLNEAKFKLFFNDFGFISELNSIINTESFWKETVVASNIKSFIAQNFVISEIANKYNEKINNFCCYYRFKDDSNHYYEIDMLLEDMNFNVIPIEIKTGYEFSKSSFNRYINLYNPKYAIVFSFNNFSKYEINTSNGTTIVYNIPLYAIGFLNYYESRLNLFD